VLTGDFARDFRITFTTGARLSVKRKGLSGLIPVVNWTDSIDSAVLDWLFGWDMLTCGVDRRRSRMVLRKWELDQS
jgi:hypothetical protein